MVAMNPAAPQHTSLASLRRVLRCVALVVSSAVTAVGAGQVAAGSVRLVGLTDDNRLVLFTAARPGEITTTKVARVSGQLLGIDYRPTDGRLYGLTSANNVYTIDPSTGVARLVCSLTLPFDGGTRSGFDFNPQSDRLRLLGSNGQNLRVHPDLGATAADAALAYRRKDQNFGKAPFVVAVAYTNSVPEASVTKTFDIDASLDVLTLQEPPNDGTLQTIGRLGVDFDSAAGFDILSDAQGKDHAYAVTGSRLYSLDLETGAASLIATVGAGDLRMIGLAVMSAARSR